MKLVENVPEYVLRDLKLSDGRTGLKVGTKVTILKDSVVKVQVPAMPTPLSWTFTFAKDVEVTLTNFLPGRTDVYADAHGHFEVHNHQVVWIGNGPDDRPWYYYSTDINNVKEVRDAA